MSRKPIVSKCRPDCRACPLTSTRKSVVRSYLLPREISSGVLILGEYPDVKDEGMGRPLSLPGGGKYLRRAMSEVGLKIEDMSLANAVACHPGSSYLSSAVAFKKCVSTCAQFVDEDIRAVKPGLIVAVGKWALNKLLYEQCKVGKESTLKIEDFRGQLIFHEEFECYVLPVWSSEYIDKKKIKLREEELKWDMQKVKRLIDSNFTTFNPTPEYSVAKTLDEFNDTIAQLHANPLWACDLETSGLDWVDDKLFLYAFSWEPGTAALIDVREPYFVDNKEYCMSELAAVMNNGSRKVFQNGAFDIKFLIHNNQPVRNYFCDTMLMHHLLDEANNHDLVTIAHEYTDYLDYDITLRGWLSEHRRKEGLKKKDAVSYELIPFHLLYLYAAIDVDVTLTAYHEMKKKIEKEELGFTLSKITMPTQRILARTEYEGVRLDMELFKELKTKFEHDIKKLMKEVVSDPIIMNFQAKKQQQLLTKLRKKYNSSPALVKRWKSFDAYKESLVPSATTYVFNPNSTKDLRELLYKELKLDAFKYTKKDKEYTKNPSTDFEVLEEFGKTHNFCAALAQRNKLEYTYNNFIAGLQKRLKGERLHTSYLLHGTHTGRPSSQNPNLNNIPREGTSSGIKRMFLADRGEWILQVDGSQLEFRTWGGMSGDQRMIRDIRLGLDIHYSMAGVVKGRELPEFDDIVGEVYEALIEGVDKEERQKAKHAVVFGPMYGRGRGAIAQELEVDEDKAEWIQNMMFRRYKDAKRWMDDTVAATRKLGYTVCLHGRRRRLPNIKSNDRRLYGSAVRQSVNSPIQGSASDITLIALRRITEEIRRRGLKSKLRATVYDSLIYTVPDSELQEMVKLTHDCFAAPQEDTIMEFSVPLAAEVSVGVRWGSQIELDPAGDWHTEYGKLVDHVKDDPIYVNEFTKKGMV
jgi:DNA polymerase I